MGQLQESTSSVQGLYETRRLERYIQIPGFDIEAWLEILVLRTSILLIMLTHKTSDKSNSTSSTATTSLTTQPANPPPNQLQAANSTSSTSPKQSPLQHPQPQHHLQNHTITPAANTPAAPANTSPKAAHYLPLKLNAHVQTDPTRPAQSLANNTMHPPWIASPVAWAKLKSNQIVKATVTPTRMYLPLLHRAVRAAVVPHRLLVRHPGLRQPVVALAIDSVLPGLERELSLIAAVQFVVMREVSVLLRARMRNNIVRGRRDDRVWLCVVESCTQCPATVS
jgi:hypothetical protein